MQEQLHEVQDFSLPHSLTIEYSQIAQLKSLQGVFRGSIPPLKTTCRQRVLLVFLGKPNHQAIYCPVADVGQLGQRH